MNFVHDDRFDGTQSLAGIGSQQEVKRFRRGDENIRGMAQKSGALRRRSVPRSNRNLRFVKCGAQAPRGLRDAHQRRAQIALHVNGQCLDRRYIEDAAALLFSRNRSEHQPVDAPQKSGQRFAGAGGSKDQSGFTARDGRPTLQLRLRRSSKNRFKPLSDSRMEQAGVQRSGGSGRISGYRIRHEASFIRCTGG